MNDRSSIVDNVADFMLVALTPALIIGMISSVAMFVFMLGYHGPYVARSYVIMFLFVVAAVLIARISMEQGKEYASIFAAPLAIVMFLATGFSVWGLLCCAVVWWVAHQVTWNCTWLKKADEDRGTGLLQELGIDRERMVDDEPVQEEESPEPVADQQGWVAWWRKQIRKSHDERPPGVTVIYFACLALPVFGIGHWFLPQHLETMALRMALLYLGCSIGLLMTTSFLGLRRYLERRRVAMPGEVAWAWLIGGTLLTVLFLGLCLLLPRPRTGARSTPLFSFGSFSFRRWDDLAWGRDGESDPNAGRSGKAPRSDDHEAAQRGKAVRQNGPGSTGRQKRGTPGNQSGGEAGRHSGSRGPQGKGRPQTDSGDSQRPGKSGSGRSKGKPSPGSGRHQSGMKKGQAGKKAMTNGQSTRKASGAKMGRKGGKSGQPGDSKQPATQTGRGRPLDRQQQNDATEPQGRRQRSAHGKTQPDRDTSNKGTQRAGSPRVDRAKSADHKPVREQQDQQRPSAQSNSSRSPQRSASTPRSTPPDDAPRSSSRSPLSLLLGLMTGIVRLLSLLLLAAVAGYLIWRFRHELLSGLRQLWNDILAFWAKWFDRSDKPGPAESDPTTEKVEPTPQRRFADYPNPFRTKAVEAWEPEEIVRYTFEAVEAWGRERGWVRLEDATAMEYMRQLGMKVPALRREFRALGKLYGQAAYAPGSLTPMQASDLHSLWERLERSASTSSAESVSSGRSSC